MTIKQEVLSDHDLTDDEVKRLMERKQCLLLQQEEAGRIREVLDLFEIEHVEVDLDDAGTLAASFDEWEVFITIPGGLDSFFRGYINSLRWHYFQQWGLEEGTIYEGIDDCPSSYRDRFMNLVGSGDEPSVQSLRDGLLRAAKDGSNYLVRNLLEYDANNPEPSVTKVIDAEIKRRFDHLMEEAVELAGYY